MLDLGGGSTQISFIPKHNVSHVTRFLVLCSMIQGSYGSLKSMKVQDILAVKIMYLKVLNFQETVEKSIKVHIKRVLLLINNYVCYFAGASFEAIAC